MAIDTYAAPTDRDETPAEFLARISNPPTPHFDKLREFAKQWKTFSNTVLSEEFIEQERHYEAKTDAYWEARARDEDDGEEVAA